MRLIFPYKCPLLAASAVLICWLSVSAAAQELRRLPPITAHISDTQFEILPEYYDADIRPEFYYEERYVSEIDQRVGPKVFLQKSLAHDIHDHTLEFTGVTVLGTQYLFDSDAPGTNPEEAELIYSGIYNATLARKLPNALTYGVNGRLVTRDPRVGDPTTKLDKRTEGRFDVYLRGIWGQLSYGDFDIRDALLISGRESLVGEANLVFAGYLSPSLERAFRYRARYSSWLVDTAVDENAESWDAALQHRTKIGVFERALSLNYGGGELRGLYDRHALSAGCQLFYGSWDVTLGLTWEQLLLDTADDGDVGVLTTVGLRYDFSRGLSFNAGYIHADTKGVDPDGIPLTATSLSGIRLSFAYGF
ncbi:MAG: hypothetical protein HYV60_01485 [Planctomycetia bacterium]|nr:hypothetical protein [Planctomycetia bacterium]